CVVRVAVLLHGHTHKPGTQDWGPGLQRHVLSDWDLETGHGAARSEVLRWSPEGWQRRLPGHC
ncbi:MAG: UDP-2,3-diacylglucosamine diphosphatase, partial [Ideonella sp.]|nr:UDP-2,3-diacylglucosamine diphosphatase [Ideonella sp.]